MVGFVVASCVYENDLRGTLVVRPKAVPKNFCTGVIELDFGGILLMKRGLQGEGYLDIGKARTYFAILAVA